MKQEYRKTLPTPMLERNHYLRNFLTTFKSQPSQLGHITEEDVEILQDENEWIKDERFEMNNIVTIYGIKNEPFLDGRKAVVATIDNKKKDHYYVKFLCTYPCTILSIHHRNMIVKNDFIKTVKESKLEYSPSINSSFVSVPIIKNPHASYDVAFIPSRDMKSDPLYGCIEIRHKIWQTHAKLFKSFFQLNNTCRENTDSEDSKNGDNDDNDDSSDSGEDIGNDSDTSRDDHDDDLPGCAIQCGRHMMHTNKHNAVEEMTKSQFGSAISNISQHNILNIVSAQWRSQLMKCNYLFAKRACNAHYMFWDICNIHYKFSRKFDEGLIIGMQNHNFDYFIMTMILYKSDDIDTKRRVILAALTPDSFVYDLKYPFKSNNLDISIHYDLTFDIMEKCNHNMSKISKYCIELDNKKNCKCSYKYHQYLRICGLFINDFAHNKYGGMNLTHNFAIDHDSIHDNDDNDDLLNKMFSGIFGTILICMIDICNETIEQSGHTSDQIARDKYGDDFIHMQESIFQNKDEDEDEDGLRSVSHVRDSSMGPSGVDWFEYDRDIVSCEFQIFGFFSAYFASKYYVDYYKGLDEHSNHNFNYNYTFDYNENLNKMSGLVNRKIKGTFYSQNNIKGIQAITSVQCVDLWFKAGIDDNIDNYDSNDNDGCNNYNDIYKISLNSKQVIKFKKILNIFSHGTSLDVDSIRPLHLVNLKNNCLLVPTQEYQIIAFQYKIQMKGILTNLGRFCQLYSACCWEYTQYGSNLIGILGKTIVVEDIDSDQFKGIDNNYDCSTTLDRRLVIGRLSVDYLLKMYKSSNCVYCGKSKARMTCKWCRSVRYCNRTCQKRDWIGLNRDNNHKNQCQAKRIKYRWHHDRKYI